MIIEQPANNHDDIRKVTAADIARVAKTYLVSARESEIRVDVVWMDVAGDEPVGHCVPPPRGPLSSPGTRLATISNPSSSF